MARTSLLESGFIDLAAVLFFVGGAASFVLSLLTIHLVSIGLPVAFNTAFLIVLAISLICSLGPIHCYTFATRRMLSEAGTRGMIFGSLLLIFSLGFVGSFTATTTTFLTEFSAALVLLGGFMCFVLGHIALYSSPLLRQEPIPQAA